MFENENNSTNAFSEASNKLNELDAAFTDPFLERVLVTGRTYNKIFEEVEPTFEESKAIITELDWEWANVKGSQVQYTGIVKVMSPENDTEYNYVFLDGAHVISNGFTIEREESPDGELHRVRHHIHVKIGDAYGKDFEGDESIHIIATGDIDNSIIESESASPERARAWLSISCPELIEEIDFRALNGTGNEDDAILALKGLDFNRYADLNDTFTRNCINSYLHGIIQVDTVVPYSANLHGYARESEGSTSLDYVNVDNVLIRIAAVSLEPAFTTAEDDTDWTLSAFATVLGVSRNDKYVNYVLPVDSIHNLQSQRNEYYEHNS